MFLSKTPTLWPPVPPPAGSHKQHHHYSGGSSHGEHGDNGWGNSSYTPKVFDDKAFAEVRHLEVIANVSLHKQLDSVVCLDSRCRCAGWMQHIVACTVRSLARTWIHYYASIQWLVTNFGTGAEKFGQTNHSIASMGTVATLLQAYSTLPANYSRGAWYAAAALITDYFVSKMHLVYMALSMLCLCDVGAID